MMNFFIWNTKGENNATFHRHCETHKPAMLVLLETKMTEHKHIIEALKFDSTNAVLCRWLGWWDRDYMERVAITSGQHLDYTTRNSCPNLRHY